MNKLQIYFLPIVLIMLLAACGGGGGGSSPSTTTRPTTPGPTTPTTTPNRAPTLTGSPPATHAATEDRAFSYAFGRHFTDPDNNNLTYSLAGNPAWLSISGTTLTGTPTNAHVTTRPVSVMLTASDGSLTATYSFTVTVANVNDPPTRANAIANPPTAMAGGVFSFTVQANTFSDADAGDSLTYSATLADGSALPSGLTFDANTRTFTGAPAAGDYSIRVTAKDRTGATATADFMLSVAMLPNADGEVGLVQAVPASDVMVNPHHGLVTFSHIGFGDATIILRGNCFGFSGTSVRKGLRDLVDASNGGMQLDPTTMYKANELITHKIKCNLAASSNYTFTADMQRPGGALLRATHTISTGTGTAGSIAVTGTNTLTQMEANDIATSYLISLLEEELGYDTMGGVAEDLLDTILDFILYSLLGERWDYIFTTSMTPNSVKMKRRAIHGVIHESVSYPSTTPDGTAATLTGLVSRPNVTMTSLSYFPHDKMIVLLHATGSTPSERSQGDAWYIIASILASRGYLVVAPDNYGRGGTESETETYLMAEPTARNAYDLVRLALADTRYHVVFDGSEADNKKVALVGYSQGAHTAISLLHLLSTQATDIKVTEVWAGGGPHSLYSTTLGFARSLTSSCNMNNGEFAYCNYPEQDERVGTLRPYMTNRIVPALTAYTDTGFMESELVTNNMLVTGVDAGLLSLTNAAYDKLKIQLQLDNFPALAPTSAPGKFGDAGTKVYLYHSKYDRLVPYDNSVRLEQTLKSAMVNVVFDKTKCNSEDQMDDEGSWEDAASGFTDDTGYIHVACGISMLNDVIKALK